VIDAELLFPLACAALALPGIPLWTAMVGPNRFYGVRTPATLADESLWYAVNRTTGRDIVVTSALCLLLSVALPPAGLDGMVYVIAMTGALALGAAYVVGVALARARHLRSPL
jgi:uncharacterized membrane protein